MASTIGRGLLAGAVGTTLLNAASYLDMALTNRPESTAPRDATLRALGAVGIRLPDERNRSGAYGALAGIATGLGVGVGASVVRKIGVRLPAPLGAVAIGGAAMAATDAALAATGVSDPRTWTSADWARDAVPHLLYGAGVRWALDRTEGSSAKTKAAKAVNATKATKTAAADAAPTEGQRQHGSRGRLLGRSLALGLASGGRASLGLLAPARALRNRVSGVGAATLLASELVIDKLPTTPSRLGAGMLLTRGTTGAVGGFALARRNGSSWVLPTLTGLAGAGLGSVLGASWRDLAQKRGYTWQAALVEDGAALGLTALALRYPG